MKRTIVMFQPLETLIHYDLRLAIMCIAVKEEKVDFRHLMEKTGATSRDLSTQMNKLCAGGYIIVEKYFKENYPHTTLKVTESGVLAYKKYVEAIKPYLEVNEPVY